MSRSGNAFSLISPERILFGSGQARNIASEAKQLGSRALLVCGSHPERAESLIAPRTLETIPFSICGEPTVECVIEGVELAKKKCCDMVIAIGGGSAIDAGKAISAMITNTGEITEYLEVIGLGSPISHAPAPFIAVPTTAGTGAEATKNAVLLSTPHKLKISMRDNRMTPKLAVIDPTLTYTVPPDITAATGLDALTQVIEPYITLRANPITDAMCSEGIHRAARSLKIAFDDGSNPAAREDMAITSLLGGISLANAGLGAVHGFAGPMGGMFDIPHGVICGRLLPFVFKANVTATESSAALRQKYTNICTILTGTPHATIDEGVKWLDALCAHLQIKGFKHYGVQPSHIPQIVAAAQNASSMKGNPVPLSSTQLTDILHQAL